MPALAQHARRLAWGVFIETQVEPLTIHATFEEAAGAMERLTTPGVVLKLSHRLGTPTLFG